MTFPSNVDVTRWGVNNATAQTGALSSITDSNLWIPTWSGEVLHAYDEYNMFEKMVDSRVITSGTTVEFPVTGTIALKETWEAGEELGGGGSTTSKFSITLDRRPIAAHFELDNIDVMIQQFEFRSELARQAGLTLANERDRQISRLLVLGAKEDSRVHAKLNAGGFDAAYGGTAYYFADNSSAGTSVQAIAEDETGALAILAAIEKELVKYRELDIPEGGLMVAVKPAMFNQIRRLGIASVTDAGNLFGANGTSPLFGSQTSAPALAGSLSYMGATIVSTNHLPTEDNKSTPTGDANYQVDARGVVALMFQRQGVASIKKQGLKVDSVEDVRRNTNFTVASMYSGGGVLRPEFCSVVVDASANGGSATVADLTDASGSAFSRAVRAGDLTA